MKKLSTLLTHRAALLRQAHLANLAFAYHTLDEFARRIARARLAGRVILQQPSVEDGRPWANLIALDGSQSVIEEHFTDEELMDLADMIAFVSGSSASEIVFKLEDLAEKYLEPLRTELRREGVAIDESDARTDALR
jgi:hypothetical protein